MYRTDFCDCDFYLISYSVAGRKLRVPGWTLQSMIIFFKLTLYLLCLSSWLYISYVSYCWQTSFIIWTHLSPTGEQTCFAGTSTVNRSPHRHSSRCWLEAPAGSSTKKLAAASGRRRWPICWCCLHRGPGSFDVEDATTLSWSSAAVSEWV